MPARSRRIERRARRIDRRLCGQRERGQGSSRTEGMLEVAQLQMNLRAGRKRLHVGGAMPRSAPASFRLRRGDPRDVCLAPLSTCERYSSSRPRWMQK